MRSEEQQARIDHYDYRVKKGEYACIQINTTLYYITLEVRKELGNIYELMEMAIADGHDSLMEHAEYVINGDCVLKDTLNEYFGELDKQSNPTRH